VLQGGEGDAPNDLRNRFDEQSTVSGAGNGMARSSIGQDSTIRRKQMSTGTKDEIKGTFHEVKGKVKETVGQVTNSPDLEAEGKAEHRAGKVEKKVGQIEKVLEK
jgi:uncharacterized protein YjbJ (UPF0337 family)